MKRILRFTVVFLLVQHSSDAQSGPTKYYWTINQAELAICRKDLPAAALYYQNAFKINPDKPFSNDLFNAYFCAMDLRQYDNARQYLKLLLSRGMDPWSVKAKIRGRFTSADLDSVNHWLAIYPNDTAKTDELSRHLLEMHIRDQATRSYFSKLNDGKYMVDSVYNMDHLTGDTLVTLFGKYGVPNEQRVGHMSFNALTLLAYHYSGGYTAHKYSHALDTFLFKAIFTYDFHPNEFVKIFSASEANVTKKPFMYRNYSLHLPITIDYIDLWDGDNETVYPQYYSPDAESVINKERTSIGLETLEELRQKLEFSRQNSALKTLYGKYLINDGFGRSLDSDDPVKAKPYIARFSKYKPK